MHVRKRGQQDLLSNSRDGSEEDNDLDPLSGSDFDLPQRQNHHLNSQHGQPQQSQLNDIDETQQFKSINKLNLTKSSNLDKTYEGDIESSGTQSTLNLNNEEEIFADSAMSELSPKAIQQFVRSHIKIDVPTDRPIRIYADGVYDLFHIGHVLQLRQAKLSFENVHLLVGVCSSSLCEQQKSKPVLSDFERSESLRHCRWVDEVIEDAPWVVDQNFINKHQIDFVAHDGEPYVAEGHDDVYAFVKAQNRFIPTRRTSGISTSDLLARIIKSYKQGQFDKKLVKIGQSDLCSR